MLIPLLLVLAQEPQQAAPSPVARVEVTPASAELQVGQTLQMQARALGADGQPVATARIRWFAAGNGGSVDSTGLVKGGFIGTAKVTAVAVVPGSKNAVGTADVRIVPAPAARVEFVDAPSRLVAGTRVTLIASAFSVQGDRRPDEVAFSSSKPKVASVTPGWPPERPGGRQRRDHRQGRDSERHPDRGGPGEHRGLRRADAGRDHGADRRRRAVHGRGRAGGREAPDRGGGAVQRGGRAGRGPDRGGGVVRRRDAGDLHGHRGDRRS